MASAYALIAITAHKGIDQVRREGRQKCGGGAMLDDDELRWIALRKMEGYRNEEMAAQLGCAPRSITRKLRRIRTLWSQQPPQ